MEEAFRGIGLETVTSVPFSVLIPFGPTHIDDVLMSGCGKVTLQVRVKVFPAMEVPVLPTLTTGKAGTGEREVNMDREDLYRWHLLITLIGSDREAGLLPINLMTASVAMTIQVKLVSVVLRGERVRVEVEGLGFVMRMRPPDTKSEPFLSCQLKEYCMSPTSTTLLFTMAEQERVTSSTPPAIRGPGDTVRDTRGGETAHARDMNIERSSPFPTIAYSEQTRLLSD